MDQPNIAIFETSNAVFIIDSHQETFTKKDHFFHAALEEA